MNLQGRGDDLVVNAHVVLLQPPAQEKPRFLAHKVLGLVDMGVKVRVPGLGYGLVK